MTDLKLLIKDCGYDETVHDYIIRMFEIKSSKVREKMINEGDDLTLENKNGLIQFFAELSLQEKRQSVGLLCNGDITL